MLTAEEEEAAREFALRITNTKIDPTVQIHAGTYHEGAGFELPSSKGEEVSRRYRPGHRDGRCRV